MHMCDICQNTMCVCVQRGIHKMCVCVCVCVCTLTRPIVVILSALDKAEEVGHHIRHFAIFFCGAELFEKTVALANALPRIICLLLILLCPCRLYHIIH